MGSWRWSSSSRWASPRCSHSGLRPPPPDRGAAQAGWLSASDHWKEYVEALSVPGTANDLETVSRVAARFYRCRVSPIHELADDAHRARHVFPLLTDGSNVGERLLGLGTSCRTPNEPSCKILRRKAATRSRDVAA